MSNDLKSLAVEIGDVVDFLKVTGQYSEALAEVLRRKKLVQAAMSAGFSVSDEDLLKGVDVFRAFHKLHKADDTNQWLTARGLSQDALELYVETNLLISQFKDRLEEQADKEVYLNSPAVQNLVREQIYQDWLKQN